MVLAKGYSTPTAISLLSCLRRIGVNSLFQNTHKTSIWFFVFHGLSVVHPNTSGDELSL